MIPKRFEPIVFGLLLSGLMSFLVSGISTFRVVGPSVDLADQWLWAWLASWSVAFPAVLVVAPIVRKMVTHLVRRE